MKHPQFHIAELTLAVVFIGVYAGLGLRTWGDFFFIHGLVISAIFLFLTYLLVVIMMRLHRKGGRCP